MSEHRRFKIRSLEQLRTEIAAMQLQIPISEDLTCLSEPLRIGTYTLPNRFSVQPMEGFDADAEGTPGPLAFRRYRRYAAGGSGLIWFEATAVVPEGRSNPGQFHINDHNVETFRRLVSETRETARQAFGHDLVLILQLTHSGRYSKPAGIPKPIIAHHSPVLDPIHKLAPDYPLISDDELDALQERFVYAAKLAAQAGFDGVDVKSCHRYLVSELLASFTREGRYGGSFENRTRMLRETLEKIRKAVPGTFITTRMNAFDAISYPYGFGVNRDDYRVPDLDEPIRLATELKDLGVPLLNVSIGNPYFNPHYGRPYDWPIKGMNPPAEHPLEGISRFLSVTRTIQQSLPELPVIGSGYAWLRQFMPNVAAAVLDNGWAALVGQGRGAFAYPDSVKDILDKGAMDPAKCCVSCSACTQIMRDGGKTGCVVHDSEIYGPQYRLARRFAIDRLRQEAERCRDCEQATCACGCPAHIDIPAFIKSFADGDMQTAYDILRANNVLPEMCGIVCPAAEQCQGQCLENIFCERPIPIQDIQLVVARTARLQGLTGVRLPKSATGRKIAVVGGGPAGLACVIKLLEKGHEVTLFERGNKLGGIPDTTIPTARYADSDAEIAAILAPALAAERLRIRYGQSLGRDFSVDQLRDEFDAVFLGVGLGDSTMLGQAKGVLGAMHFLRQMKSGEIAEVPASVAVLGAGNTAMDAALTAKRAGAQDVYLVYRRSFNEMPAWAEERNACLKAGVHFLLLSQPLNYETDVEGRLTGLNLARTELGEPDASGRRSPRVVPGSESTLPVKLVVEALGQQLSKEARKALAALELTPSGLVTVQPGTRQTSMKNIYAGGDIINGGATAVQGIVDGMQAAEEIDQALGN
jgi:NADPH-dependent glutamate synthase beta subunit-like oxidoreductase/2,4-dienoyl-CoA reductase-like NADH-dependent reductase (Old Yellow Enzyme family)